jgi:hypothetical protein
MPEACAQGRNAALTSTSTTANVPKQEGSPSKEGEISAQQASSRTKIAVYDNVAVEIDSPEHASWYGNRDKIKNGLVPMSMVLEYFDISIDSLQVTTNG